MLPTDLEASARARLDAASYAYFSCGAGQETTLTDNISAWQRLRLRPRILRNVSSVDTVTTVLGCDVASPVLIAPFAMQGLLHPAAECDTMAAAAAEGTIMTVSSYASRPVGEIARAAGSAPWWFQVYLMRDRGLTRSLVEEAKAAGAAGFVLTADTPYSGRKPRVDSSGFSVPAAQFMGGRPSPHPGIALADYRGADPDPAMGPQDIGWLRDIVSRPVIVKGVLRADDALLSLEAGAAAVIVSNHGGRQLDGSVATADALPEVVQAVSGAAEVYVDGGIRSGTDVLRALALGARAALIGRPAAWALATGGTAGVRGVLQTLREELELAMALAGSRSTGEITADLLDRPRAGAAGIPAAGLSSWAGEGDQRSGAFLPANRAPQRRAHGGHD